MLILPHSEALSGFSWFPPIVIGFIAPLIGALVTLYAMNRMQKASKAEANRQRQWAEEQQSKNWTREDAVAESARMEEEARQARIAETVNAVNAMFDAPARQSLYEEHRQNIEKSLRRQLDQDKVRAERETNFALARRGLTGGSSEIDANRELKGRYDQGTIQASGQAQEAAGALRKADEAARLNLTSMASAGLDQGTAAMQAANAMDANSKLARSQESLNRLGDMFGPLVDLYRLYEVGQGQGVGAKRAKESTYLNDPNVKYGGTFTSAGVTG